MTGRALLAADDLLARMARTWKLRVRLNGSEHALLIEYQRDNGFETKSAAVRDMIRRQARYSRWKLSRRGKEARTEVELRTIAREILREHPEASRASLGYNMMKRAGKIVDAELIKRIANEMVGSL